MMRKADEIIQRRVNDGTIDEMFGLFDKFGLNTANKRAYCALSLRSLAESH